MIEKDPILDPPATAEELEAAARLARALENGLPAEADPEAAAVVLLLGAVAGAEKPDSIRAARLRADLVRKASRPHRRLWTRHAAAAALVLAAGAALLVMNFRRPVSPAGEQLMAGREQAAREALASVAKLSGYESRQELIYDAQWQIRLDASLETSRYGQLAGEASASAAEGSSLSTNSRGGSS